MSKKKNRAWLKKHKQNEESKISQLLDVSGKIPSLKHANVLRALFRGENTLVAKAILQVLKFYAEHTLQSLDEKALRNLNATLTTIFSVVTHEKFQVPKDYASLFVANSHILANMTAISLYETTDAPLQVVLSQENNMVKVCFLYTIRNKLTLPISNFFDINPALASRWYISAMAPAASPTSELLERNLKRFYREADDRLVIFEDSCHVSYFSSSYINDDCDKVLKPKINQACKRQTQHLNPVNTAKEDKIAIVTSKWFPNSAVCKSARPLIEKLFDKYHVTLIHTGFVPKSLMTDGFDEVIYLKDVKIDGLLENDFKMIYYCDIGMTPESVLMSNLRLAPIQVMSYGHPSSTFGSEVDYFIGGEKVECLDKVQEKYAERMVLISGMGCLASYPNYQRTYDIEEHDDVVIQCTWGPDKYNYPSLMAIKRAFDRFEKPAKLHFYPSVSINRNNCVIPYLKDVKKIFGDVLTVWTQYEYFDYMKNSEKYSDMLLNSPPPFGGFNTCVEAMYLDMPVLHCHGDTFRTMVGGVLNDRVGLSEWNTNSLQEWEDRLVEVVNTEEWREAKKYIQSIDIKEKIFSGDEPTTFLKAIDYLMEHGDKEEVKNNKSPLIIK